MISIFASIHHKNPTNMISIETNNLDDVLDAFNSSLLISILGWLTVPIIKMHTYEHTVNNTSTNRSSTAYFAHITIKTYKISVPIKQLPKLFK